MSEELNVDKFKSFLNSLPIPSRTGIFEHLGGPKRTTQIESVKDTMLEEIENQQDDFETMEAKINCILATPEEMQQTFETISNLLGTPFVTTTEVAKQPLETEERFTRMLETIEETVFKEVTQYLIATEIRENGTLYDLLHAAKAKSEALHEFIMDLELPVINEFFTRSKYAPRKIAYLS